MHRKLTASINKTTKFLFAGLQFGRVFRKLGLPIWTFVGIGMSALWFNNVDAIIKLIIDKIIGKPVDSTTYISPLITFLIPCLLVWIFSIWNKQNRNIKRFKSKLDQPKGKKGLIILVSQTPDSAKFAIEYHCTIKNTLEKVYLIPSNSRDEDRFGLSTQNIAVLIQQYIQGNFPGLKVQIENEVSPADAQDTFDAINRIFRTGEYEIDEIIADFTGGTKPMSVGMIMACLPTERELEYVAYNRAGVGSSGPFLIDYQHTAFDLIG